MKFKIYGILFFLLPVLFVTALSVTTTKKIRFIPHWQPQAQFAGYYVALDKGFYNKYGLDVQIVAGGPKRSSASALQRGDADFALMWLPTALELNSKGTAIVNLRQLINKSTLILLSKKEKNITKPEDLNGKKIGIWGADFSLHPLSLIEKFNIKARTINQGNSINLFMLDGIDVASAMLYNEYHSVLNAGINSEELNILSYSDYGLNIPEDGIYCKKDFFESNPDVCKNFVFASLEGWRYAFDNENEALSIMEKYIKAEFLPFNKAHQRWMLRKMKDIIYQEVYENAHLKKDDFDFTCRLLSDKKLINKIPDYNDFNKKLE